MKSAKPSSSGCSARCLPRVAGLVHFHDALVVPTASTRFPWPCGTVEEAEEIVAVLAAAAWDGRWDGGGFAVLEGFASGYLRSTGTDWGADATDNVPEDLYFGGDDTFSGIGDFVCRLSTGECE